MYTFAVVALMALAIVKVVDFVVEYVGASDRGALRSVFTFALALGGIWLMDFNMFAEWGMSLRSGTIGVWVTGFTVAGFTVAWRAAFGYLTHDRATVDETLGQHRSLKKVA